MGHSLTLKCPKCEVIAEHDVARTHLEHFWQPFSENAWLGAVEGRLRKRKCQHCGTSFETIETATKSFKQIEAKVSEARAEWSDADRRQERNTWISSLWPLLDKNIRIKA